MKSLKAFITYISWGGALFFSVEQISEVKEFIDLNPRSQMILFILVVIFWVIKIVWFVMDKFYLETRERNQKWRNIEEDIKDKQEE